MGCNPPGNRDATFCLHGFTSDQEVLIYKALDEWNSAIGSNLNIGENSCDVRVIYAEGITNYLGSEGHDNSRIKLWWDDDDQTFRITMLHEVGHYLANSGEHLKDPNAVMYYEYNYQNGLTDNDIQYVNK